MPGHNVNDSQEKDFHASAAAGARSTKGTKSHGDLAVGCKCWLYLTRLSIREMIDAVEYWHLSQLKWIDTF